MPTAKIIKRKCEWCESDFLASQSDINRGWGRFCCVKCGARYTAASRPLGKSKSKRNDRARRIYIERNGMPHCQHCGASPADIHHMNEDTTDNSPENLMALCRSCHIKYHNHVSPKRQKKAA